MERQPIREFSGRIIGWEETDSSGKITLRDFYGRILGYYDPNRNETRDFYGRILGCGNCLGTLLR